MTMNTKYASFFAWSIVPTSLIIYMFTRAALFKAACILSGCFGFASIFVYIGVYHPEFYKLKKYENKEELDEIESLDELHLHLLQTSECYLLLTSLKKKVIRLSELGKADSAINKLLQVNIFDQVLGIIDICDSLDDKLIRVGVELLATIINESSSSCVYYVTPDGKASIHALIRSLSNLLYTFGLGDFYVPNDPELIDYTAIHEQERIAVAYLTSFLSLLMKWPAIYQEEFSNRKNIMEYVLHLSLQPGFAVKQPAITAIDYSGSRGEVKMEDVIIALEGGSSSSKDRQRLGNNVKVLSWCYRFFMVMTTNHSLHKNDFYQQQGLAHIVEILHCYSSPSTDSSSRQQLPSSADSQHRRQLILYALITLCNLLTEDVSVRAKYSILQSRQQCLEQYQLGDLLMKIERYYRKEGEEVAEWQAGEGQSQQQHHRQIVSYTNTILKLMYSNLS